MIPSRYMVSRISLSKLVLIYREGENLMNIIAPDGISMDQHKEIIKAHRCKNKKCGSRNLRPISFVRGENSSAFCYECIECHENDFFVYTKKPTTSPDQIINIVNTVGDLNKQIQEEPSQGICPKCKKGKLRSIDKSRCHRMVLDIVECNNCGFSIPVISIVRDTLIAYSYNIQLAKKVAKDFPEVALVFCISALETYFRQLFQYRSELNEFLVKKRKVNFQNLDESKDILKMEFNIDIVRLIEKDWTFLRESSKSRNNIIHHASYDVNGKKIELSEEEIYKLISIVNKLVIEIEMWLFDNEEVI
jgi:predicted RNA-binding Zn-ribbon protein involved in translation (DUF1610 family)